MITIGRLHVCTIHTVNIFREISGKSYRGTLDSTKSCRAESESHTSDDKTYAKFQQTQVHSIYGDNNV